MSHATVTYCTVCLHLIVFAGFRCFFLSLALDLFFCKIVNRREKPTKLATQVTLENLGLAIVRSSLRHPGTTASPTAPLLALQLLLPGPEVEGPVREIANGHPLNRSRLVLSGHSTTATTTTMMENAFPVVSLDEGESSTAILQAKIGTRTGPRLKRRRALAVARTFAPSATWRSRLAAPAPAAGLLRRLPRDPVSTQSVGTRYCSFREMAAVMRTCLGENESLPASRHSTVLPCESLPPL